MAGGSAMTCTERNRRPRRGREFSRADMAHRSVNVMFAARANKEPFQVCAFPERHQHRVPESP